jgi:hypothetical protein
MNRLRIISITNLLLALTVLPAQTIIFRDVAQESGIEVTGALGSCAAFADYDHDGDLDICFNPGNRVYLYRNNGDRTFTDVTAAAGLSGLDFRCLVWGDYNNDGNEDILANSLGTTLYLFRNNGNGTFTDLAPALGLGPGGNRPLFLDFNRDGLLDVLVIGGENSRLYQNLTADSFRLVWTFPYGGNTGTSADYDNDLNPDIYIARDGANKLYRNNGDGTFTDVTSTAGVGNTGSTQAAAFGDFDQDGDLDLYITNISGGTNKLYRNNGDGTFTDVTSFYGVADVGDGRTCDWIDFNNDRLLDLFTTNHVNLNRLFRNMGNQAPFLNVAGAVNIANPADVFAASWGDYDCDGDLDAFLVGHFGSGCALMRDSGANALHWLKVKLIGTQSNRSAIGARLRLFRNDTAQTQEISGGSGQYGANPTPVHFGLGTNPGFDSLTVFWPSGAVSRIYAGSGDTTLIITEPATGIEEKPPVPLNNHQPCPGVEFTLLPGTAVYNVLGTRVRRPGTTGVYFLIMENTRTRQKLLKIR